MYGTPKRRILYYFNRRVVETGSPSIPRILKLATSSKLSARVMDFVMSATSEYVDGRQM